jgi:hypothetical protein
VLDINTGLSYSTNEGNLRLLLADLLEDQSGAIPSAGRNSAAKSGASEMEEMIER